MSSWSVGGEEYDRRFDQLAASGHHMHGEADLVDWLLEAHGTGRSVLDAGCGTGRVAIELWRRGRRVVGVDADRSMLGAARRKAPEVPWIEADLADPSWPGLLPEGPGFDLAVLAGNVMVFLAPGTEGDVLAHVAATVGPGGLVVSGFSLGAPGLTVGRYDHWAAAAGLEPVARWATWDREAFSPGPGASYAVSVHRRPALSGATPARSDPSAGT